jgi:tetratricopeptide (TPR) repeat protein
VTFFRKQPLLLTSVQTVVFCCALFLPQISMPQARSAAASPVSAADEHRFKEAMSALNAGNFAQAEGILKDLRARHSRNYEINESLGLAYASQDRLPEALPLLQEAAREQPKAAVSHANLGTAYLKLGRNREAAAELEIAAQIEAGNAQTLEALGQAWMLLQQPQKAAAAFSQALIKDGDNPDLLYNSALAFFDAGDAKRAEMTLARMPGVESSSQAQSLYGDVEEKLGNYQSAAQHDANAAQLAPTEANIYLLGVEFLRHWTFVAAIKEFQAGLQLFPESRRMRLGLGAAYFGNSDYDQAAPVFADLLESDPDNLAYADLLGRACTVLAEGLNPKCAGLLAFAEKHPANAMLNTYAATSILHGQAQGDRLDQARRFLQAAIAANPDLPQARYEMGLLLQRQGQWQDSIPELQAAIRSKPDYAEAHYHLALAYSHTGRKDQAKGEIALQQKYSQQQDQDLDARMKGITTLLVNMK